jgi:two-component system, response regulator PdtaR
MKQIIIVEDDLILSLLLEKQVTRMGYHVAAKVNSGEEAVEKIRKHLPDLVLMDIKLVGEMDGVEAIEQIREFTDVPVLYLTGNSDETTRRRARATNPVAYMIKPVDMTLLKGTIRNILEKSFT